MNISYTGELRSKQGFSTRRIGVKSFDSWDAHNEVILPEPSSHCFWGTICPLTVFAICPLLWNFKHHHSGLNMMVIQLFF